MAYVFRRYNRVPEAFRMRELMAEEIQINRASTTEEAMLYAAQMAEPGDVLVLLSAPSAAPATPADDLEEAEIASLRAVAAAAIELAEYTSYAEIAGGVTVNRATIRKWCDEVFAAARTVAPPADTLVLREAAEAIRAKMGGLAEIYEEGDDAGPVNLPGPLVGNLLRALKGGAA